MPYSPLIEEHLRGAVGEGSLHRVAGGAGGPCCAHDVGQPHITDLGLVIALGQQHICCLDVTMQYLTRAKKLIGPRVSLLLKAPCLQICCHPHHLMETLAPGILDL